MKVGDKGIVVKDIWYIPGTDSDPGYWTHEDQPPSNPFNITFPNNQFEVYAVTPDDELPNVDSSGYEKWIYINTSDIQHWYFSKEDAEKYLSFNKADRAWNTLRRLR